MPSVQIGEVCRHWLIKRKPTRKDQQFLATCLVCNNERKVSYTTLFYGKKDHCGCQDKIGTIKIGDMYGFWRVLAPVDSNYKCLCKCTGCNETERKVEYSSLLKDKTKSCGCKMTEFLKASVQEKYGVEYTSQSTEIQNKKRETRLRHETILTTSDGTPLTDICAESDVAIQNAFKIFHEYGEEVFLKYCETYTKRIHSTELQLITLLQKDFADIDLYNRNPKEFKLNRKPDFRLEKNDNILYINIDGLYTHSEIGISTKGKKKYHLELRRHFDENNQMIFQFREDELRDKGEIIRSIILNYFGLSKKIYARHCQIVKVKPVEARKFFEGNHLMGAHHASTGYGLYYQDKLVCCMSVINSKQGLDIARFTNAIGVSVQGGFSKLLKYVAKKYNPQFIKSFCDLRYSTGRSYSALGFELKSISLGWQWTDKKNTFNRLKCRANMDERKLSEKEYAEELKWYKIYDAGQAKYVLDLSKPKNPKKIQK